MLEAIEGIAAIFIVVVFVPLVYIEWKPLSPDAPLFDNVFELYIQLL